MANGEGVEARTIALQFLNAVASRDCDRILGLCSDQVVFEWPMVNERVTDPEVFRAQVAPVLAPMEGLTFHDVVVDDMSSPNEVTLRYRGSATMSTTGRPYRQTYISQIHVDEGKVTLFREYYNPAVLSEALTPET